MVKTFKKSTFHPREAHILTQLYVTVLYTIFLVFENIEFQLKTQKGDFSFIETH
jgi:hypothetical protein